MAAELETLRGAGVSVSAHSLVVDWYDGGVGEEVRGPSAAVGAADRLGAG